MQRSSESGETQPLPCCLLWRFCQGWRKGPLDNGLPSTRTVCYRPVVPKSGREFFNQMPISRSGQWPARTAVLPMAGQVTRGEFFAALLVLGCVNGLASRIIHAVAANGWASELANSFDVSAIVWLSCVAGISIILHDRTDDLRSADLAVGAGFLFLVILPVGPLSWLAVTLLCLYVLVSTSDSSLRRGAAILLATTVPMLWGRMFFEFFASPILQADALLVSWLLGTSRTGNMVEFADGSGLLDIEPPCSSFTNVSLAFLCWVTFSRFVGHKKSVYDLLWCLLACAAVVVVNTIRLSVMGLNHAQYHQIHGRWGDMVANTIILCLTIGFCALGVRRELFPRA